MRRLQNQLILAFLAVILTILCGVSTALLLILRNNPQEERLLYYELNIQARSLTAILRLPRFDLGGRDDDAQLQDLAERQESRLGLANSQTQVLFDSAHRWDTSPPVDVFANLRRGSNDHWQGVIREDGKRWLVVAHPILVAGDLRGYLIAARPAPTTPFLQRFRDTMAWPLLQAGLVALALGVILALLISRSIASPLQKVAAAARALAAGNLNARAPVEGPEEVQALAQTFNEMAHQVQVSRQAQRDLVANVAHDLRTPLTSIQGFAQALVDGTAATPEAQTRAANAIHEEAQRMHRMTNSLLELARFEAGEVTLRQEAVNLTALARTRVEHFRLQAEEAGIHLSAEAGDSVTITGDPGRLEQVLDNLLSNALAHTAGGGRVTVFVGVAPPWAELAVADSGSGIPPEELPRIFERFYRGDRSRRGSGMGLGLAIVQEIVRAHGGAIQAESVVGVGSKFTVRLPLLTQQRDA